MRTVERLREAVLIALEQLRAHTFRSALTVLGVVIGVATVMAMSGAIAGVRSVALAGVEAAGPKNFIVARYDFIDLQLSDDARPPWWNHPKITPQEAERIASLSHVKAAIVELDAGAELAGPGGEPVDVQLSCDGAGWDAFTQGAVAAGRNFTHADVVASRPVAVLSAPLAASVFGSLDPIGRTVRINGRPFDVIGTFQPAANIFGEQAKNFAVVPYTAALKHLKVWDGLLSILVVTRDGSTQAEAIDQVTGVLRAMRGLRPAQENDFAIVLQEELLASFQRLTGVFFIVMLALSSVALLVGGVGVIAIMLISVTERTREIGVRKALGARRREILWQFLFEASTLTVAGAVAGLVLGVGEVWLLRTLTPIPGALQPGAIIAALVMAAVAGIAFGLFPAWRASRLDPVVALRYE